MHVLIPKAQVGMATRADIYIYYACNMLNTSWYERLKLCSNFALNTEVCVNSVCVVQTLLGGWPQE